MLLTGSSRTHRVHADKVSMARTKRSAPLGHDTIPPLLRYATVYQDGRKRAPVDGGVCICHDNDDLRGTGDCYLCERVKNPNRNQDTQPRYTESRPTGLSQERDGAMRIETELDEDVQLVEHNNDPSPPIARKRFSLKLRRQPKTHDDDGVSSTILENTNTLVYETVD